MTVSIRGLHVRQESERMRSAGPPAIGGPAHVIAIAGWVTAAASAAGLSARPVDCSGPEAGRRRLGIDVARRGDEVGARVVLDARAMRNRDKVRARVVG